MVGSMKVQKKQRIERDDDKDEDNIIEDSYSYDFHVFFKKIFYSTLFTIMYYKNQCSKTVFLIIYI